MFLLLIRVNIRSKRIHNSESCALFQIFVRFFRDVVKLNGSKFILSAQSVHDLQFELWLENGTNLLFELIDIFLELFLAQTIFSGPTADLDHLILKLFLFKKPDPLFRLARPCRPK